VTGASPGSSESWSGAAMPKRARVVTDNDYSGDPDGIVQLAHHLLSPSVDVRCVIGSAAIAEQSMVPQLTAEASVEAARKVANLAARPDVPILQGSVASEAIVAEAMRDDTDVPLYVACGGGLSAVAEAWQREPRISERVTVVWIGGLEHPDLATPPPDDPPVEWNTWIDFAASKVVFNESDLRIWQVPRDAYRQVLASRAELLVRMRPHGALGEHLYDSLAETIDLLNTLKMLAGETYVLGDSPLVLLTALFSNFHPAPSSSSFIERPRPRLVEAGGYEERVDGPPLRVFTRLDSRLVLEDLYAKLELHARDEWQPTRPRRRSRPHV
jgi:purine nucleosidase